MMMTGMAKCYVLLNFHICGSECIYLRWLNRSRDSRRRHYQQAYIRNVGDDRIDQQKNASPHVAVVYNAFANQHIYAMLQISNIIRIGSVFLYRIPNLMGSIVFHRVRIFFWLLRFGKPFPTKYFPAGMQRCQQRLNATIRVHKYLVVWYSGW